MLLVKLSADDIRIIRRAGTPAEFEGALSLVRDRIDASELLRKFGKQPTVRAKVFRWQEAFDAAKEVLGDRLTMPPYPESSWFRRINSTLRNWALDADKVREVAEHVRDKTRPGSVSFDWMICQHPRIMKGEYDQTTPPRSSVAVATLPEE